MVVLFKLYVTGYMHNRNIKYRGLEVKLHGKFNNRSLLPMVLKNAVYLNYRNIPSLFTFIGLMGKARYIIERFLSLISQEIPGSLLHTPSLKNICFV